MPEIIQGKTKLPVRAAMIFCGAFCAPFWGISAYGNEITFDTYAYYRTGLALHIEDSNGAEAHVFFYPPGW